MRIYDMKWGRVASGLVFSAFLLTFCAQPEMPGEETDKTPAESESPGDKPVLVSEITITPSDEISLEVGKTVKLNAEVSPDNAADKTVSWSSESVSVASVNDEGLVSAQAVGEAKIVVKSNDGGAQAVKTVTVFKPQAEAYTSVKIVRTTELNNRATANGYKFDPGETFTFQAEGTPADAPDEIEFICSTSGLPAFLISPAGKLEAISGNQGVPGYIYARSKKNPNVKSDPMRITVTGLKGQRAVLCEMGGNDFMPSYHPASANLLRHTKYIGKASTQKFAVKVERKDESGNLTYLAPVNFEIDHSDGPVEFSLYKDGCLFLVAKTKSDTPTSTLSQTVKSTVTIKIGTYTRTVDFIVSELDPYKPKIGDGLHYENGHFLDGGYRGNYIFEEPNYEKMPCNAMIAWLGSRHFTEDPLCTEYCNSGIVDADGRVTHGIAIPVKIGYLYRSSRKDGEIFSDNSEDLTKSDALPSWFSTERLRWDTYYKMTAFSNTAALVYRNGRNGTTHDVIPMNYFVNSHILEPSSDESKKITVSSFSWESYFYGDYETGNIKSKDDPFSARTTYSCYKDMFTPWLMPSMSDLFYIFSGDKPEISSLTETSPFGPGVFDINEKVKVFMTCGKRISGSSSALDYVHSYWTCQQRGQYLAPLFTVTKASNSSYSASVTEVTKTDHRAYVLPIAYF